MSVNLPRWGLKRSLQNLVKLCDFCVNLPRWGLKRRNKLIFLLLDIRCKFTPLGFET